MLTADIQKVDGGKQKLREVTPGCGGGKASGISE
jgi:hypothetical protein